MIHALAFVLATMLVLTGAAIAVGFLRISSRLDNVIGFLTLAASQIVITLLLAGVVVRDFQPVTVLWLNALVVVMLALSARATRRRLRPQRRRWTLDLAGSARETLESPWLGALLALTAAEVVWRIFVAGVLPASGFDALWYHLTSVAWWLQEGTIGGNPFVLWSDVYPSDGELFAAWVAVFLRSDTLVDIVQLPFALLGGLAVAGIGRTLGLSGRGAAAAGALFFLSPIVLVESSAAYVDVVFVSGFLVGLHFLLRFVDEGERGLLLLAGLGGGLAAGSKYVGGLYCGVLFVGVIVSLTMRRTTARAWPSALLLFVMPVLAVGGFWYLRNWVAHGHPIFPYGQQSETPFLSGPEGCQGTCLLETLRQWHQDHVPFVAFHRFNVDLGRGGLGPLWSYLAAPAALIVLAYALVRCRRLVWGLYVPIAVLFAIQPYRWWSRFTIVLLAVGGVALVFAIERLPPRLAGLTKLVALGLVVLGLSYSTPIASVFDALGKPVDQRTTASVSPPWFAWVDGVDRGRRIAVDTSTEGAPGEGALIWYFFPLFGDRFQHSVFPVTGRDEAAIRRMLVGERTTHVIVGAKGPYAGFARRYAHEGCLRPLYEDETALVYRVELACLRRSAIATHG